MFSGIIEAVGQIEDTKGGKIKITCPFFKEIKIGQSIAHDGVCLTISEINKKNKTYTVELMPETFKKSHFKSKKIGDYINLERSLKAGERLDGHIVQGHTDFVGKVANIKKEGNSSVIRINIPNKFNKFFVNKGSVSLNGISLTVIKSGNNFISVGIIPHTLKVTNLKYLNKGDIVNIETDILAKYFVKLMGK